MNRLKYILAVAVVAMIFVQCSSSKKSAATATAPTAPKLTDQQKLDEIKQNYTQAQLEEGHTVWQASCGKCHTLYAPGTRNFDQWERILPRMAREAKLSSVDAGKVRAYILSNAKMN